MKLSRSSTAAIATQPPTRLQLQAETWTTQLRLKTPQAKAGMYWQCCNKEHVKKGPEKAVSSTSWYLLQHARTLRGCVRMRGTR
jgi:hypothetical protein